MPIIQSFRKHRLNSNQLEDVIRSIQYLNRTKLIIYFAWKTFEIMKVN